MSQDERAKFLAAWSETVTGVAVSKIFRRPGGGRHEAWDVEFGDAHKKLFLRTDVGEPAPYEKYTLRREAEIYSALYTAGLPVPEVLAIHPDIEAVLLGYVSGTAPISKLPLDKQNKIIETFVPLIAKMHKLDPREMNLPSLSSVVSIREHVDRELDMWETRLNYFGKPQPFLQACLRWLRENNPEVSGVPSLVQGDTGPGNFLHDGEKVTALLDFELSHIGDPMEDLAWIGTRNAQEPVPDFARIIEIYERETNTKVDLFRLKYHMLLAEWRIAVLATERGGGTRDVSASADVGNQLIYGGALHLRLTCEAMAAVLGVDLGEWTPFEAPDTDVSSVYDAILFQMKELVVPNLSDPFASGRAKGMSRALKFLREVDKFGSAPIESELADLSSLLGHKCEDLEVGRQELQDLVLAGKIDAKDLLQYEWKRICWNHTLIGGAMGVLAKRHLPRVE